MKSLNLALAAALTLAAASAFASDDVAATDYEKTTFVATETTFDTNIEPAAGPGEITGDSIDDGADSTETPKFTGTNQSEAEAN